MTQSIAAAGLIAAHDQIIAAGLQCVCQDVNRFLGNNVIIDLQGSRDFIARVVRSEERYIALCFFNRFAGVKGEDKLVLSRSLFSVNNVTIQ